MKAYESMILTYINKYKDLNFDVLSKELRLPVNILLELADQLFLEGYINSDNQDLSVTEKGNSHVFSSWNELSIKKDDRIEKDFQWDDLYIPENFLDKI